MSIRIFSLYLIECVLYGIDLDLRSHPKNVAPRFSLTHKHQTRTGREAIIIVSTWDQSTHLWCGRRSSNEPLTPLCLDNNFYYTTFWNYTSVFCDKFFFTSHPCLKLYLYCTTPLDFIPKMVFLDLFGACYSLFFFKLLAFCFFFWRRW